MPDVYWLAGSDIRYPPKPSCIAEIALGGLVGWSIVRALARRVYRGTPKPREVGTNPISLWATAYNERVSTLYRRRPVRNR
jgi:hypothetical protein